MLRVLGRTEAEISPLQDKAPASKTTTEDENGKRRRKSRVSFGNIQTAIFQKDTDWTADASPSAPSGTRLPTHLVPTPHQQRENTSNSPSPNSLSHSRTSLRCTLRLPARKAAAWISPLEAVPICPPSPMTRHLGRLLGARPWR